MTRPSRAEDRLAAVAIDFNKAARDLQHTIEQIRINTQLVNLLEDFEVAYSKLNAVVEKMNRILIEISSEDKKHG